MVPGRATFLRLSLASRFALAGGVVLVIAMAAIGTVVTGRIEEAVVRNSANATAIYMESVIAPISQQLIGSDSLSPGAQRALEEIFTNTALGERVVSYKFWRADGTLLEASNPDLVGQRFDLTDDLRRAWEGEVMADFDSLGDAEDVAEAALGVPLLEIYSPIREVWSGEVIAVAEFYEINPELSDDLRAARQGAWLWVGGTGLALGSVLYLIVLGGSRTIDAQRRTLDARLDELAALSDRNEDLRRRIQAAAGRAAAQAERTMRRIGADLHDGPAQDLAYAALRLDALGDRIGPDRPAAQEELAVVREAVRRAMTETRALSRGLSLPDIAGKPPAAIVRAAAEAHALRTGHVAVIDDRCATAPALPDGARICLFRFVQEGLNNASRHAGGQDLHVTLDCRDGVLRACVADRGPGLPDPLPPPSDGRGLGLSGLRDRVEALGGSFAVTARAGGGTELTMTFETGDLP